MNIPITKPDLTELEISYAHKALTEGEIGVKSSYVQEFEERLADYLGFKYAVFCNSGWSALLLASRIVKELGYDYIETPTFSMIATATAPKQAGLEVGFKDVNGRGLLEGVYETQPIIAVDIYGKLSPARSKVFTIEDAAEIFGKQKYYGDIVCFSFFYNKIITTGNGGACLTNDENLYKELKLFRHHYYDGHSYEHEKDGYNVSQSGVLAAVGIKQLERADEIIAKRNAIGQRYFNEIGGWQCDVYWYYPFLCSDEKEKIELKSFLEKQNIATRDFFNPLHKMPPFQKVGEYPVAQSLYEKGILLPCYGTMTKEEQDYIIENIHKFYEI